MPPILMQKEDRATMKRRVKTLQKRMAQLGPVMRGSVVIIGTRNKQSYFSLTRNKRTQLMYLGKKRQARAQQYSDNYKELRVIVEEMTMINMTLLKKNACL
jgi:hypothetical protein